MMTKHVVIATPDAGQRRHLATIVDRMRDFDVIAQTGDLMNTYNVVEEKLPKAVLIADVLAALPEFEVMRALFSTLDIRWLVVTLPSRKGRLMAAPAGKQPPGSDLFSIPADAPDDIYARQLAALTRLGSSSRPAAKTHGEPQTAPRRNRPQPAQPEPPKRPADRSPADPIPRPQARSLSSHSAAAVSPSQPQGIRPPARPAPIEASATDRVILIGASTGGVDALLGVLTRFPADCPPTLVVQHTGTGFGESLAGLLDRQCLPTVQLANGTHALRRGLILIGAGIRAHLVLEGRAATRATTQDGAPMSGHVPSVDRLFASAVPLGSKVSAALLTGMGRDGAEGLKALRDAGAFTVAQDEASCVVYGMPRAAVELRAAQKVLPLGSIAEALLAERRSPASAGTEARK